MIRHIVLIKFQSGVTEETIADLFGELCAIQKLVPGVLAITAGRSESPEKIERGYMHGFVADFQDWDTLEVYQSHPAHKELGTKLVANAIGGLDGILVLDIPVAA
jgi:stress responsive alpha/beta barrel protein